MIEVKGCLTHFSNDRIDDFIQSHLDLRSFVHIFELADSFLGFHDTDDNDESRTDSVCFFELDLDTWSTEREETIESLFSCRDIERKGELLCFVPKLHDVEVDLVLVAKFHSTFHHRLYETLSPEGKSYSRHLTLVSYRLRESVIASTTTECILCPT